MKLAGKVIVVTGAGSGMGRELVLELLRRGARVAAVDLNEQTLAETAALAATRANDLATYVVNITDKAAVGGAARSRWSNASARSTASSTTPASSSRS